MRLSVVGEDGRAAAWSDPIAVHIRRHRGRQHDTRAIVVGEDERTLNGAGRQDDAPPP